MSEKGPLEMYRSVEVSRIRAVLGDRHPGRIPPSGFKIAAVLVPLFRLDNEWQVLLTKRTDTVESHKGEISFPGGHREPDDPDLEFTALRETEEEIGVGPDRIEVAGRLDDIITVTGYRVRPYVGILDWPVELAPQPEEIAEIIVLPIREFLDPGRYRMQIYEKDGTPFPVYFFDFDGYSVWGATAKILRQLMILVFGFRDPEESKDIDTVLA